MKTRALGFLLMVAAAGVYAVGCGSSNNNGGTGGAGTGGKGGAAGAGAGGTAAGGTGAGGKVDAGSDTNTGAGGKADSGTDTNTGAGGKVDGGTDTVSNTDTAADMAPGDAPADTQAAPTFTQVYAIISNATVAGCTTCHDGTNTDGGAGTGLPHGMNFTTKAAAYAALVGVDSIRCGASDAGVDGSAALKRVLAGNAAQSVLVQKLLQGMGITAGLCDTAANSVGMPLNVGKPTDGGAPDGGYAGFTLTTYAVTAPQLTTIQDWINAGALNN